MLEFIFLLILCVLFVRKFRNTDVWKFATSDGIFKVLFAPTDVIENVKEKDMDTKEDCDPNTVAALVCKDCNTCKKDANAVPEDTEEDEIVNVFNVKDIISHNLTLKKFFYPKVYEKVLANKRVQENIKRVAETETDKIVETKKVPDEYEVYEKNLNKHRKRAVDILKSMQSNLNHSFLFATSYVLHKAFPKILSGIFCNANKAKMLADAKKAMPGVPFIFLPLHRSHMDYMLLTFYLFNNNIKSPLVAAGENLKIPVFGFILRGLGAFFIKRKIDPEPNKRDYVYRSVLQVYMEECLKLKHNFEFFIEGGRTRTGKPIIPKSGILSVVIEAFQSGLIKDALIVPVSFNYEKLVEGNYVNEQLGNPKKKESFVNAVKNLWKIIHSQYGYVNIDFSTPYSLKELIKSINVINHVGTGTTKEKMLINQLSSTSLYGVDMSTDQNRLLIDSIARHVIYDCSKTTMIMPTNAVSYLLLHYFRNGATVKCLASAMEDLAKHIGRHHFFGFDQFKTTEDLIWHAVSLMKGNLLEIEMNGFIRPRNELPSAIELSFYSNILLPHIALDSLVCICASLQGPKKNLTELIEVCLEYCDMLKYEFVFTKPCICLTSLIKKSIEKLRALGIIHLAEDGNKNGVTENINQKRRALIATLSPINHCYLATAESLDQLIDFDNGVSENDFIKICLRRLKYKIDIKKCIYPWSVSVDSIKNCIKLLQKWAVLEGHDEGNKKILFLNSLHDTADDLLEIKSKFKKFIDIQ